MILLYFIFYFISSKYFEYYSRNAPKYDIILVIDTKGEILIMKKRKHFLFITLVLCLCMISSFGVSNVHAASKSTKAKRTKALIAYQKKLKTSKPKLWRFALIYLNNDSIPELALVPRDQQHRGYAHILCYTNGKVKVLKNAGSIYGFIYYSKKKSVVAYNGGDITPEDSIFYRYTKNWNAKKLKMFEYGVGETDIYPMIDRKKVSQNKFDTEYKKMLKNILYG